MLAGSRGYGALKRTALGSVAGHLVDSAACPVLVLPRGEMDPLGLGSDRGRALRALSVIEVRAADWIESPGRRRREDDSEQGLEEHKDAAVHAILAFAQTTSSIHGTAQGSSQATEPGDWKGDKLVR